MPPADDNRQALQNIEQAILSIANLMNQTSLLQARNPYKARATKSANQSLTDAVVTQITFDTETYDANGNFASNVYTAPVDGYYQINMSCSITSPTSKGVAAQLGIRKNGTAYKTLSNSPYPATTIYTDFPFAYSDLMYLTAGNTIDFTAYIDTSDSSAGRVVGVGDNCSVSFHLVTQA